MTSNIKVLFLVRLLIFCLLQTRNVQAAAGGRLFALSFLNLGTDNAFEEIMVSSFQKTTLFKITIPQLNYTEVFSLDSSNGWKKRLEFSKDISVPRISVPWRLAVIIASETDPINVQVNKAIAGSTAGYLALPIVTRAYGGVYNYYVPSYSCPLSVLSVIAVYKDTCMEIDRWANNGMDFIRLDTRSLQANEVFNLHSANTDYTGIFIMARKPLAVFGGCDCAKVPDTATAGCDHIWEQVPPIQQTGRKYVLASISGRPYPSNKAYAAGFNFRVIGGSTGTDGDWPTVKEFAYDSNTLASPPTVVSSHTSTDRFYRGQWFEKSTTRDSDKFTVVTVSCPGRCLVMQYNPSDEVIAGQTTESDPYMVLVPPVEKYTSDITFSTARVVEGGQLVPARNYLTVLARDCTTNPPPLTLDGTDITSLTGWKGWVSVTEAGFTDVCVGVFTGQLGDGFHTLTSSDAAARYTAFVYGHGNTAQTAYGYLAGYEQTWDVPRGRWYDMAL